MAQRGLWLRAGGRCCCLLLLLSTVGLAGAAGALRALPIANSDFSAPATAQYEAYIEGWAATNDAGVYRVPPDAYPQGLPVSFHFALIDGCFAC